MISEQTDVASIALERLITQVRGVLAVRVAQDEQGQIQEVHIVSTPDRSAKQVVRDTESILYVRGGVRLDHRKISVVQIEEGAIQPGETRLQLAAIERNSDDNDPGITVTLGFGEQRIQGLGSARSEDDHRIEMLVGYAVIHALDKLVGARGQLRLEALQDQQFGPLQVCLAHVSLTTDNGIETLLGISIIRDDLTTSAARAVLDAINRRLPRLLREG